MRPRERKTAHDFQWRAYKLAQAHYPDARTVRGSQIPGFRLNPFVEVDRPHYSRLTERGRRRRHARRCLELFDDLSRRAAAA